MTFIYVVYLIYGDPDDNTCFEPMSFHQTLLGAAKFVETNGECTTIATKQEYRRLYPSTAWMGHPGHENDKSKFLVEKTTVWL